MQLVIPMSGLGSRFSAAGYEKVKPLIEVFDKPMIEWVLKAFPEDDVIFICRNDHIEDTNMVSVLNRIAPNASTVAIPGHKKGPVYAISLAFEHIDDDRPVLISYCDYYMLWDYAAFKRGLIDRDCDGAIPCYTGFHPNLIPKDNLYASCRIDDEDNLIEIREKHSFSEDKIQSLHSPGVYYFRSGSLMKKYCQLLLDEGPALNGEYYNSLVYNRMVEDGLKVWTPANVSFFCQWGTPHDLQEFEFWVNTIREINQ